MTTSPPVEQRRRRPWLPRIPIVGVLLVGFGGLVLAAVLTVLAIGIGSSRRNTFDLLSDKAELVVTAIEQQIRLHLEPARHQAEFVARMVAARELDIANRAQVADVLYAAQAGSPEVSSLILVDTADQATLVARNGIVTVSDWSDDGAARDRLEEASKTKQSYWGEVLWTRALGAFINLRTPLWRDGVFIGGLGAVVQVGNLSRTLQTIPGEVIGRPFILRGRDEVLAHPSLAARRAISTDERQPLPLLAQVEDAALEHIWDPKGVRIEPLRMGATSVHQIDVDGHTYVFLTRELRGYGPTPWIIGTYFNQAEVDRELNRLVMASLAGAAVLVVALIAAIGFARMLGRPILAFARSAEAVRSLDLAAARPLRRSVVRELDEAGRAFNQMLTGLRWFETYVPRRLVAQLIGRRTTAIVSTERRVTVLFTDIRGFTTLSERFSATEVAALLNEHFALIDHAVEAEEGIVDKYIGDSVMAFWGAPSIEPDHAARAIRASRAISTAIISDNRRRVADGLPAIRVAVGLHTGLAVAGNVGPAGRVNYTIVGDTVNSAARVLNEAKDVESTADVVVLASGETVRAAGEDARDCRSLGTYQLRGRMEAVELFRVV